MNVFIIFSATSKVCIEALVMMSSKYAVLISLVIKIINKCIVQVTVKLRYLRDYLLCTHLT